MSNTKELKSLRGWLILVGISIILAPIVMLISVVPAYMPVFEDGAWAAITTPGSEAYIPYFGPLLMVEVLFTTLLFVASLVQIYLFFSRHRLFPAIFIGFLISTLAYNFASAWMLMIVIPGLPVFNQETTGEILQSLIIAAIWVPYMLFSERVSATFSENRAEEPDLLEKSG